MQGPRTIQTAHRVIQGIEAATLYQEIGQTEGGTGLAQKKLPVGNEALRKLMEPGNTAGASSRFLLWRLNHQIPERLFNVVVHVRSVRRNDHDVSFADTVRLAASDELAALG